MSIFSDCWEREVDLLKTDIELLIMHLVVIAGSMSNEGTIAESALRKLGRVSKGKDIGKPMKINFHKDANSTRFKQSLCGETVDITMTNEWTLVDCYRCNYKRDRLAELRAERG